MLARRSSCRNIRVLHHFEPPTTEDEIRAADLQYVRKVSGRQKPLQGEEADFEHAIETVAAGTRILLARLAVRGPARTREGEREESQASLEATRPATRALNCARTAWPPCEA